MNTVRRIIAQGDTIEVPYDVRDPFTDAPVNLGGNARAVFAVKSYLSDPDDRALFRGTLGNGVFDRGAGRVIVLVPATTTAQFPRGDAVYSITFCVSERRWVAERGVLRVLPSVSIAT